MKKKTIAALIFLMLIIPINAIMVLPSGNNFTETDTLQTVTDRGATTDNDITIDRGGLLNSALHLVGSVSSTIRSTATDLLQLRHNGINAITINGAGDVSFYDDAQANSFITVGGDSNDFVKGDGSLDSNTYITAESDTLQAVTDRGATTDNDITVNSVYGYKNNSYGIFINETDIVYGYIEGLS
jgi:hypothetical protein